MIEDRVSRSRIDDRFGAGAPKASRPIDIRLPGTISVFGGLSMLAISDRFSVGLRLDRAIQ
jgi:hypothetical protein